MQSCSQLVHHEACSNLSIMKPAPKELHPGPDPLTAVRWGMQIPDGKPANSYGFKDQCMNKEFTLGVIAETHDFYKALKSGARANDKELALA